MGGKYFVVILNDMERRHSYVHNSPAVAKRSRCVFPPLFDAPDQATTQKGVSQYAQQKFEHKDHKHETKNTIKVKQLE